MDSKNKTPLGLTASTFMDSMIRLALITLLAVLCVRVFSPFLALMVWALIFAIVLFPLYQRISKRLRGRRGLAAIILILPGLLLIGTPLVMLGDSFASHIGEWQHVIQNDELKIEPPDPAVAEWPIIGNRLHKVWSEASENLPQFVEDHYAQLDKIWKKVVEAGKNTVNSIFLILGALLISGIMMAFGKSGSDTLLRIISRVAGPDNGPQLHALSAGTVRSVAVGVLGVAFIQAVLFGIGFILAKIPAAGVLALIVMFIGIIQLPAAIVSIPVIIYLWVGGDASITSNIIFTVFFGIAGLADNFLKPLLLGRGVDAPMPVILIGALGGMIAGGIVGMFIGAILLAVGYQIFMAWVNKADELSGEQLQSNKDEQSNQT